MVIKVKFKRVLLAPENKEQFPMHGNDVLAIKRVISRAGFWPWGEFDDKYYYRVAFGDKNKFGLSIKGREGVAGFQKKYGIKPTGNWNLQTHNKSLTLKVQKGKPHYGEPIWDQRSINLYGGFEDKSTSELMVGEIFGWWNWLVSREPSYHYSQQRPIPIVALRKNPPNILNTGDCSGTLIACTWLAGAKSPDSAYGYSGYGNTDSLIDSGMPITESQIDEFCKDHYVAAFYGPSVWDTRHVVAVENSKKIYSHGREAGPEIIHNNLHYHNHKLVGIRAYKVI